MKLYFLCIFLVIILFSACKKKTGTQRVSSIVEKVDKTYLSFASASDFFKDAPTDIEDFQMNCGHNSFVVDGGNVIKYIKWPEKLT